MILWRTKKRFQTKPLYIVQTDLKLTLLLSCLPSLRINRLKLVCPVLPRNSNHQGLDGRQMCGTGTRKKNKLGFNLESSALPRTRTRQELLSLIWAVLGLSA